MREVTETVAFDAAWDFSRREKVRELFDGMAAEWSSRSTPEREASILDALDRGGLAGDTVIELGSGTGLGTGHLIERFDDVVALDLSMAMLRHQPDLAPKVQADASVLPFRDDAADLLVLVNMLLFPAEVDRVLRPGRVRHASRQRRRTPRERSPSRRAVSRLQSRRRCVP
ncbi:MAG: methyltransferase domain-containing protein [Acidimicrobiia bacterium]|nr:methyltransferase domain-containing protein [Acidimicrobiia bacterium]